MKISLNWVKKYVDLPDRLSEKDIAYDLTLRTVEVESVERTRDKFHDIVVGKIIDVQKHPEADLLKVCKVIIDEEEPVQIVCGGTNLYNGEYVVISKPGSEVYWHGEAGLVKIKKSNLRGVPSYGMICGANEVYLENIFPPKDESEIVDLKDVENIENMVGENIVDALGLEDTIIEIDNKSLTNRPDLWGHYGIARELSAIYNVPLKKLDSISIDANLPKYDIEIKEPEKCPRYAALQIDNVSIKESPMWMKIALINGGMRPINAIVDITNYVMLAVGQPTHAFDATHVEGNKIIVRNAKENEKLLLLDHTSIDLTTDDLVIADIKEPMALAGIRGGAKDSILDTTTSILLEVANFTAKSIRKTGKRFDEKTDASIRYEKNIDTERVDDGINLAVKLFKELFRECKITKYNDNIIKNTQENKIEVKKEFLDTRLGKVISVDVITTVLKNLGYKVTFENNTFNVTVPTWRSTGDVSIKDDVMGDIARLLSFESFEAKPLTISLTHAVLQNKVLLEMRLKKYLAERCGFNEIFTYPWTDEKYIDAAGFNKENAIKLATPPSPEEAYLRTSLIPNMLKVISKNLRYYSSFKLFEMAQVFEKGEYHESSIDETLPIHKKYLTGCIVGDDPEKVFFELKGVLENMSRYNHMNELTFQVGDKPSWADINVYMDILLNNKVIGNFGLVSIKTMTESKIKRKNVAIFELNVDKLEPYASRTNTYSHISDVPLVEKDLSILVNEDVTWADVKKSIEKKAKKVEFIEEYHGNQIPDGMKSIMLRVTLDGDNATLTGEEINKRMESILKSLSKNCNATLRLE